MALTPDELDRIAARTLGHYDEQALLSVSSQFDGPMITIDDAEQPSLSVISDGVLANGDFAIKFSDVHQGHDQERRQR